LKSGVALEAPTHAHWFGKPEGMSYAELFAALEPSVARGGVALWMRQMVLGPAREFCLHAMLPLSLPDALGARRGGTEMVQSTVSLRAVWPHASPENSVIARTVPSP